MLVLGTLGLQGLVAQWKGKQVICHHTTVFCHFTTFKRPVYQTSKQEDDLLLLRGFGT